MRNLLATILGVVTLYGTAAHGGIIGVNDLTGSTAGVYASIIGAPRAVTNSNVTNLAQQGFNEAQNVLLAGAINVDGGTIAAGTLVSSHMIFLNKPNARSGRIIHFGVDWLFDGTILGVMSDGRGRREVASTDFLGAPGTIYPVSPFSARGLESNDSYFVSGNMLTVNMRVRQPGDWIRVVTAANVPEPGALGILLLGLLGLGIQRRARLK